MSEQAGRYQGRQFGNYHLLRLISEGGSAEVYLGKHVYLDTEVAIKILDARLKASEFTQFSQEARTLSTLHHPNIVQILDFGLQDDLPFLVMSYASQGSLGQRHPSGSQLPLNTTIPIRESQQSEERRTTKRKEANESPVRLPPKALSTRTTEKNSFDIFLTVGKKNAAYHLVRNSVITGNFSQRFLVFQHTTLHRRPLHRRNTIFWFRRTWPSSCYSGKRWISIGMKLSDDLLKLL